MRGGRPVRHTLCTFTRWRRTLQCSYRVSTWTYPLWKDSVVRSATRTYPSSQANGIPNRWKSRASGAPNAAVGKPRPSAVTRTANVPRCRSSRIVPGQEAEAHVCGHAGKPPASGSRGSARWTLAILRRPADTPKAAKNYRWCSEWIADSNSGPTAANCARAGDGRYFVLSAAGTAGDARRLGCSARRGAHPQAQARGRHPGFQSLRWLKISDLIQLIQRGVSEAFPDHPCGHRALVLYDRGF